MKTPPASTDALFEMEHRIARRADELDREFGVDRSHALDHWRQAEREVWGFSDDAELAESWTASR